MREIKFRAWDEDRQQFSNQDEKSFLVENNSNESYNVASSSIGYVLEQYTGLHDKNGKDIYEGDVVKCVARGSNAVFIFKVAYSSDWAMFYIYSNGHKPRGLSVAYYDFEVIGNIHENKELLDEKV